MSNDFFNASGTPAQGSQLVTPAMRAEFAAIAAGFDKLPALTGNAYEVVYINASGSAMASVSGDGLLKLSSTGVPSIAVAGTDYMSAATIVASSAAVPNDTDVLPIIDSTTAKKLSLTNLKAFLKTYFDTLYGTVASLLASANTWTNTNTFRAANAVRSEAASTQDAVIIAGRAGGSSSYAVTITPSPLSGNRTATLPDVSTTMAGISIAQAWSAAQRGTYTTLTDAATIAVDLSLNNFFKCQLGGNRTLGAATGVVAGQSGQIDFYQDATGSRTLAYAWMYQFAGGTAPTLSTAKFAKDSLAYMVNFYKSMTVTNITNGANAVVTSAAHGMFSGQKVQFSALSGSTGLATATSYWVTVVDADTFKLSSSLANCIAGTYITTSSGFTSGTLEAATITLAPIQAVA